MLNLSISTNLYQLSNKGYMAWEYNPFHNYRITKKTDSNGLQENQILYCHKIYTKKYTYQGKDHYEDIDGNVLPEGVSYTKYGEGDIYEAGCILDMETDKLAFDLEHPVTMDIQPSYDGTVNVIINDNKNIPRLINSRFSTTELNTYEIVDRIGDNDTNIYDDQNFDLDTSLYKRISSIPKIKFLGINYAGELKVGNYNFYFKYADADGNETDFVADSGIVAVFKGNDSDPLSADGGVSDQNSFKGISFKLTNIDDSYNYITVYYTRSTGDSYQTISKSAFKIDETYVVRHQSCTINITGLENTTAISQADIDAQFFQANKARTSAQCQNRLFLGNVAKPEIPYDDLTDISLRMLPTIEAQRADNLIGSVSAKDYTDDSSLSNNYEYYNTQNIYYRTGYWDEEIYRLGVVYILEDNTLTNVFNIRGGNNISSINDYTLEDTLNPINLFNDDGDRQYITVDEDNYALHDGKILENSRGVVRFKTSTDNPQVMLYFIKINIPKTVIEYLQSKYNIKGLFFVRQKRNPLKLAEAYILPYDKEGHTPVLMLTKDGSTTYYSESFLTQPLEINIDFSSFTSMANAFIYSSTQKEERLLYNDYDRHLVKLEKAGYDSNTDVTAICPEFMVNQSRYNALFTGTSYVVQEAKYQLEQLQQISSNHRMYYANFTSANDTTSKIQIKTKIVSVTDDAPSVAIGDTIFRSRIGNAEEAERFRYIETNNKESTEATNLLRGIYSPYLGMVGSVALTPGKLVDIYIPNYSESLMSNYFSIRYDDNTPYYSIGDRVDVTTITHDWKEDGEYVYSTYARGDCYICTFTHRLNRNFSDSANPYNDEILDEESWKNNYDASDTEKLKNINRGDVNAVQLGSWISFKLRCSTNLSIRSTDSSNLNEVGIYGRSRAWYPIQQDLISGNNKIPDSYLYNQGLRTTLNEKRYIGLPDVPYIKNIFQNRIIYSDIAVNDAYRNGYRVFKSTHYVDYTKEYGAIIKLVPLGKGLICVFEHGVVYLPVNERVATSNSEGEDVYLTTNTVIPETISTVVSDTFGSQWSDSIIKTPYGIYGVDTVGKKIWVTDGTNLQCISDFKVNKFLVDNLSLSERETSPIIGIRNVKTHYNANKHDVMFTFYDQKYGFEDKAWNLCYNELLKQWTTFYSWIPSDSENIDNIFFSFNRDVSKQISSLGTTSWVSTNASGLIIDDPVLQVTEGNTTTVNIVGIANRYLPTSMTEGENLSISLEIQPTFFNQHTYFSLGKKTAIIKDSTGLFESSIPLTVTCPSYSLMKDKWMQSVLYCNIKGTINIGTTGMIESLGSENLITSGYYDFTICVVPKEIYENTEYTTDNQTLPSLLTDFWKHGQAGIIDVQDHIKPCYWYNKQHPFEFEFVVHDNLQYNKIWDNIQIISNKAEPESFHYTITGDSYEFGNYTPSMGCYDDRPNMYYRQEATKEAFQKNGSNITFDHLYNDQYRGVQPSKNVKSTILPLYYNRVDTVNTVEDYYYQMVGKGRDYIGLSGGELIRNEDLNQFDISIHVPCVQINAYDQGILRGNTWYQENQWYSQIPPINFMQKNEKDADWVNNQPPIVITRAPEDLTNTNWSEKDLPNTYNVGQVQVGYWTFRKQAPVKDKYIKIKIRYSGKDLAIITGILTTYRISQV